MWPVLGQGWVQAVTKEQGLLCARSIPERLQEAGVCQEDKGRRTFPKRRIECVKREATVRWPDGCRCGLQNMAGANGEPGVKRGSQVTLGPVCLSIGRTLC